MGFDEEVIDRATNSQNFNNLPEDKQALVLSLINYDLDPAMMRREMKDLPQLINSIQEIVP